MSRFSTMITYQGICIFLLAVSISIGMGFRVVFGIGANRNDGRGLEFRVGMVLNQITGAAILVDAWKVALVD